MHHYMHIIGGCSKVPDMRTTLNIDDDLIKRAQELTGITEKTAIVKMGIEALIARESAKRLARLGGTDPTLKDIPRRRA